MDHMKNEKGPVESERDQYSPVTAALGRRLIPMIVDQWAMAGRVVTVSSACRSWL
jgi:hypothetical protein